MTIYLLLLGAFIGFDLGIGYAWITARRARTSRLVRRVRAYTARPW